MILQIAVTIVQSCSMGLAYWPYRDLRRWGSLTGLAAQPLWFAMLIQNELYFVLPIAPAYGIAYTLAAIAHWRNHWNKGI